MLIAMSIFAGALALCVVVCLVFSYWTMEHVILWAMLASLLVTFCFFFSRGEHLWSLSGVWYSEWAVFSVSATSSTQRCNDGEEQPKYSAFRCDSSLPNE